MRANVIVLKLFSYGLFSKELLTNNDSDSDESQLKDQGFEKIDMNLNRGTNGWKRNYLYVKKLFFNLYESELCYFF